MAGPAKKALPQRVPEDQPVPSVPDNAPGVAEIKVDTVQQAAARLYGLGYKRPQVMEILLDHIAPKKRPNGLRDRTREEQQSVARTKLRRWEHSQKFRDLMWEQSLIQLDLQSPDILQGVGRKAKIGRVDAARLAFELTGRHNPKGDEKPTEINVNIASVPRP